MTRADDWRWGMVPQPLASARSATPAARFAHHRLPIRQTRNRCHIHVATVGHKTANIRRVRRCGRNTIQPPFAA